MHEMGITQGILAAALEAAESEGATRINEIRISVGELTEVVEFALQFAFEVLRQDTMAEQATLVVDLVTPRSRCSECGTEFEHGRFEVICPECGSFMCELLQGRELRIDSIDVDEPEPSRAAADAVEE